MCVFTSPAGTASSAACSLEEPVRGGGLLLGAQGAPCTTDRARNRARDHGGLRRRSNRDERLDELGLLRCGLLLLLLLLLGVLLGLGGRRLRRGKERELVRQAARQLLNKPRNGCFTPSLELHAQNYSADHNMV